LSLYIRPRRNYFWRYIILLLIFMLILVGLLVWQRGQPLLTNLSKKAPKPLATAMSQMQPEPTAIPTESITLVHPEAAPNPQSSAYTADLYVTTTLDKIVPWPNVDGRTKIVSYTIQSGDSGWGIANKFNLDLNTLFWGNPELKGDNPILVIGTKLRILPVQGVYHVVTGTETIDQIAARYGVPTTNITNYPPNGLTAPFKVKLGYGLIVPFGRKGIEGQPPPPLVIDSPLAWPLVGLISKGFHPESHPGININAPEGTMVYAAGAGKVRLVNQGQDNFIMVIEHADGLESWYGHLLGARLESGDSVAMGDPIGEVARSGSNGVGPFLYFSVYQDSKAIDPLPYLPGGQTK